MASMTGFVPPASAQLLAMVMFEIVPAEASEIRGGRSDPWCIDPAALRCETTLE
jgi:hypothetical protein